MEMLWCTLYPDKHGGSMTFDDDSTCPECGSEAVPKDELDK